MLFDFRSPLPYGYPAPGRSFLHEFLAFEAPLLLTGKLSVCSSRMHHVSIQRTECADTTKQDAVRRRFKDLDRKSDGRSVYIYIPIYIYISWQRRRWPPNWGLAEARPNKSIEWWYRKFSWYCYEGPIGSLQFKGSVERSSLPWAILQIFTRNRPWKSEDHLCTLFCIEMSKESLEKSERTPPVSWRPWALAYSRDRPYNFSCLSAVSKNGRFGSFFLGFGVSFGEEEPFMTSNVSFKQETRVWASKTNQTVRWLLSACVPIRFCPEAPASSTVDINSRFSRFQFSAFWSSGLASSVFIFAPILLRFFLLSSSMQGLQYVVTDFLISTHEKSYASSKPTR